jgi:phasin family protein
MATKDNFSNANFYKPFGGDTFKFFQDFKNSGFQTDMLLTSYRKNMQALEIAQKATVETLKALAQAHSQYTRQTMEDTASFVRHLMASGNNTQEKFELQSKSLKANLEKAVSHSATISSILNQSHEKIMKMANHRFNEYVDEVNELKQKSSKEA